MDRNLVNFIIKCFKSLILNIYEVDSYISQSYLRLSSNEEIHIRICEDKFVYILK